MTGLTWDNMGVFIGILAASMLWFNFWNSERELRKLIEKSKADAIKDSEYWYTQYQAAKKQSEKMEITLTQTITELKDIRSSLTKS